MSLEDLCADEDLLSPTEADVDRAFVLVPAQSFVATHLATYKDYPPRQKPGSFALDDVLSALQEGSNK